MPSTACKKHNIYKKNRPGNRDGFFIGIFECRKSKFWIFDFRFWNTASMPVVPEPVEGRISSGE
jgi:hypothetical protein